MKINKTHAITLLTHDTITHKHKWGLHATAFYTTLWSSRVQNNMLISWFAESVVFILLFADHVSVWLHFCWSCKFLCVWLDLLSITTVNVYYALYLTLMHCFSGIEVQYNSNIIITLWLTIITIQLKRPPH